MSNEELTEAAVVELSIHFMDEQNRQILWGRLSEVMQRWYTNRPPANPGEMLELVNILGTFTAKYLEEYCSVAYEALPHKQQLLECQDKVAEFLAEQLYYEHKGKKF